ncbi:uncharacterized protein FFB20_05411 [Fusarium fujikuroi]|nr:uncharacterized protein Y057_10341 [Fusarium fujikuroi]QGI85787.1 hypothetical protein CEK25_012516 [Fusarium fujikuroi]QGI99476.1 hypothetical protein CEK26_012545 [Fusarium fujikuroi]SCN76915.1 uncharacterized protein FFB20_05411 [Fusarium fujikuroi]SCO19374.1 uncharacterized protein FFE2_14281 [Fusarium fujikuroi]
MPPKAPKAPKGGETLASILIGGTLYAVAVTGMASLFEQAGDKKDSKEESKQAEPNWLQRNFPAKEKGYYMKQAEEEFREHHEKLQIERQQSPPTYDTSLFKLTEQDRLQAENMLKP